VHDTIILYNQAKAIIWRGIHDVLPHAQVIPVDGGTFVVCKVFDAVPRVMDQIPPHAGTDVCENVIVKSLTQERIAC